MTTLSPAHLFAVGYLAVAVTALAFVLWYGAVAALGPGRAGLLTGVVPVAAAGVGAVLGGPVPGPVVWAGIVLVGVGLALGVTDGAVPRRARTTRRGGAASDGVVRRRAGDRATRQGAAALDEAVRDRAGIGRRGGECGVGRRGALPGRCGDAVRRCGTLTVAGCHDGAVVAAVGKAAALLRAFGPSAPVLSVRQLAARTGVPRSTVHALATTLAEEGLLDVVAGRGYRLGPLLVGLAGQIIERTGLVAAVEEAAPLRRTPGPGDARRPARRRVGGLPAPGGRAGARADGQPGRPARARLARRAAARRRCHGSRSPRSTSGSRGCAGRRTSRPPDGPALHAELASARRDGWLVELLVPAGAHVRRRARRAGGRRAGGRAVRRGPERAVPAGRRPPPRPAGRRRRPPGRAARSAPVRDNECSSTRYRARRAAQNGTCWASRPDPGRAAGQRAAELDRVARELRPSGATRVQVPPAGPVRLQRERLAVPARPLGDDVGDDHARRASGVRSSGRPVARAMSIRCIHVIAGQDDVEEVAHRPRSRPRRSGRWFLRRHPARRNAGARRASGPAAAPAAAIRATSSPVVQVRRSSRPGER